MRPSKTWELMMAMNDGVLLDNKKSIPKSARGVMSSKPLALRRRRSKGTMAGYASSKEAPYEQETKNAESACDKGNIVNSTGSGGNQPQHALGEKNVAGPPNPCISGRLALLCCQNAIRMGARTQLGLCPPGRTRRAMQSTLRNQSPSQRKLVNPKPQEGGLYGLDKMVGAEALAEYDDQEENFLLSANTFDIDSDEEASSGDEDELTDVNKIVNESAPDNARYFNLREPLFIPAGTDSTGSVPNPNSSSLGSSSSGKLPFNYRKIKYFDAITAPDRIAARAYLTEQTKNSHKREGNLLYKHLRRMQRHERRKVLEGKGQNVQDSDEENDDPQEPGGLSPFSQAITPSMSAALIIESLSLNTTESTEGMEKCYDGIVAAGVALLDAQDNDSNPNSSIDADQKARTSRSEIMAALAPLLITSLEQPSGDAILSLARLRVMCGTARYKRRFVQRVAPCLIRPANAAMWCLKHQNDIEPILAAAELIFDSSEDTFGKGWYERGRLLLADSKRAETLNSAAEQLRNLSSADSESLTLGCSVHSSHHRRKKPLIGAKSNKDISGSSANEPLAEWEVIAVDRQIRISISNIISMNWSRAVVHTRETDTLRAPRRSKSIERSRGVSRSRLGASLTLSADASPTAAQSPHSPHRRATAPLSPELVEALPIPLSPPTIPQESIESVFGPSFSMVPPSAVAAPSLSPGTDEPPPPETPPPSRHRDRGFDDERDNQSPFRTPPLSHKTSHAEDNATLTIDTGIPKQTPPRSPIGLSKKSILPGPTSGIKTPPLNRNSQMPNFSDKELPLSPVSQRTQGPLSPIVSISNSDIISFRLGSTSSTGASPVASVASSTASYRMLTSSAAERKRTVAACRALRAQISRFEEAFVNLHGRPPKGAAERAPLATTYAQYREWKRAIRADAACRIQALFRGASTRWKLLRSKNTRLARVIMTRAGRSSFGGKSPNKEIVSENILNNLSIPVEIGGSEPGRTIGLAPMPAPGTSSYNEISKDPGIAPHWSAPLPRRRSNNQEDIFSSRQGSSASQQFPSPSMSTGLSPPSMASEMIGMSMSDLAVLKRDLKSQLKQYDMKFARTHGRMPVKAEKEPIRHLYENYNALKTQMVNMEQEGQSTAITGIAMQQQRTPSPPTLSSSPEGSSEDLFSSFASGSSAVRGKGRKTAKSPPVEPPNSSTSILSGTQSQDLPALKAEKGKLHQMLRSYEKDFFKDHKRQVSSFNDIKPVASQYRRYKEIKKAIAQVQAGEK